MKTAALATLSGAMFALAIAGAACQSSSSGDTSGAGAGPGAGGDSSAGGSGTAGSGTAGSGTAGTGTAGTGTAGSGTAGTGTAGSGTAGSGTAGSGTAGSGTAGSGTAGTSAAGAAGAGGKCGTPTTLHPPDPDAGAATIYCPFGGPMGMGPGHCIPGMEHCCEGGVGDPTMCLPLAMACPQAKATDWQCEDPADCGTGKQCCGNGSVVVNPDPMCANFASKMTGTTCKASCDAATEITMCTSDAECGAGKTCIPFGKAGNQVGGCSK